MRAIVFDLSMVKYALEKALGRLTPRAFYGPGSCLSLREVRAPALRGPDWARVQVELAGVCGSDLALITLHSSPALSPFNSFPSVMGHEIYGRVVEAGRQSGVREGDRVVVEPLLGCAVRGFDPPCERCARGEHGLCSRMTEGELGAGMMIGFCAALPGGWSETVVAHRTQLIRVPDPVSDEAAVLLEPTERQHHRSVILRVWPGAVVLLRVWLSSAWWCRG
jgi:threonine dehydrogenase-like Zn-dependent dehydrogenase